MILKDDWGLYPRKSAFNKIKEIAIEEINNARESLLYLDRDSALGYEQSMGYAGGRERVE